MTENDVRPLALTAALLRTVLAAPFELGLGFFFAFGWSSFPVPPLMWWEFGLVVGGLCIAGTCPYLLVAMRRVAATSAPAWVEVGGGELRVAGSTTNQGTAESDGFSIPFERVTSIDAPRSATPWGIVRFLPELGRANSAYRGLIVLTPENLESVVQAHATWKGSNYSRPLPL